MIAIGYSVLNHRLKLLLTVVHVKHLFLYVAVAVLKVSLDKSSSAIRLLRMMYFTSSRHFTWMSVWERLHTRWVIRNCLPSLVKEIWLLSKLCTIRIVVKSCTIDTEVTTIGNQVIEKTWRWFKASSQQQGWEAFPT